MPFQPYEQDQMTFLPQSLDELIPENDLVRVVDAFVNALPVSALEGKLAKETGRPSFHPRLMLKVILYAYVQRIYSCRAIAKVMRQNVFFMWVAAGARPDFNTVNRFRTKYLAPCMEEVFASLASFLIEKGYVKGEEYYVDGTKLEADAGKFTYVWRKNVEKARERVERRVREIMREADALNEAEDCEMGSSDFPECGGNGAPPTAEEIRKAARKVAEKAKEAREGTKAHEKKSRELEKEAEKMAVVEERTEALGGRNSFSKTDKDATFIRMKNDELRAGYNLQVGTEEGFVLSYSVSQNANDASAFIEHMENRRAVLPAPSRVCADAGYGTEENHAYLEENGIESHLKDQTWFKDRTGKHGPYEKGSFLYDEVRDVYTCPEGKTLSRDSEEKRETKSGYETTIYYYRSDACAACPVRTLCAKGEARIIRRSPRLEELLRSSRANIESAKGIEMRKKRGNEVETVFADMKYNQRYTRVRLRGLAKAALDLGYVLLSQNLRKLHLLEGPKVTPQML